MTTAREHMANDMAWLFAREGEEVRNVVIDGVTVRAMVQDVDLEPGSFEGLAVQQKIVTVRPAALGWQPTVGSVMTVEGKEYLVAHVYLADFLLKMTLTRNVG